LPGERVNGLDFLEQVADNKADMAFVPRGYEGAHYGLRLIRVDCVLSTLQEMAKNSLNGEFVVGITGSLGKTTTKEFIYQLLVGDKEVEKTYGSQNGQIGLPLSLLNRDRAKKVLVLEYGIDERGGDGQIIGYCDP